jgi:hypothetical protein
VILEAWRVVPEAEGMFFDAAVPLTVCAAVVLSAPGLEPCASSSLCASNSFTQPADLYSPIAFARSPASVRSNSLSVEVGMILV